MTSCVWDAVNSGNITDYNVFYASPNAQNGSGTAPQAGYYSTSATNTMTVYTCKVQPATGGIDNAILFTPNASNSVAAAGTLTAQQLIIQRMPWENFQTSNSNSNPIWVNGMGTIVVPTIS